MHYSKNIPEWGLISKQSNGEPDFQFTFQNKLIGVEIKRLFINQNQKKQEEAARKTCENLTNSLQKDGTRGASISFLNSVVSRKHKKTVEEKLLSLIERYRSDLSIQEIEITDYEFKCKTEDLLIHDPLLAQYVHELSFSELWADLIIPGGDCTVGYIRDLSHTDIQTHLDKFEQKKSSCTENSPYEENWLVMTYEDKFPSSWFRLKPENLKGSFLSSFDQVFVLDPERGQYVILDIHKENRS